MTLDVRARKMVVDEAGVETEVPMDEWVEIGIFDDKGLNEPLYLQMHRIRTGTQTITVTVPRKPARAGIDPHHLLIEVETDDNVEEGTNQGLRAAANYPWSRPENVGSQPVLSPKRESLYCLSSSPIR